MFSHCVGMFTMIICPHLVVGNVIAFDIYPSMVFVGVLRTVHAGEEHILCIFVLDASGNFNVAVFLVGSSFLFADEFGSVIGDARRAIAVLHIEGDFGGERLSVEERAGTVLLASQIFAQGEDVLRRVLIHRRVGGGTDNDDGV